MQIQKDQHPEIRNACEYLILYCSNLIKYTKGVV